MFDTIDDIISFYKTNTGNKHQQIYDTFNYNMKNDRELSHLFHALPGFGEDPFQWNWKLLVDTMPSHFRFLEIGVYKGRVCTTVGYLAERSGKSCSVIGISPLDTSGDKYSTYDNIDYKSEILTNYKKFVSHDNLQLIKGYSQDTSILQQVQQMAPFDILFIDGSHDYNDVVSDIQNYSKLVNTNGYVVMDDASLYVKNAYGRFLGHPDVSRAANEVMDTLPNFEHLYVVGHNRVWRKLS